MMSNITIKPVTLPAKSFASVWYCDELGSVVAQPSMWPDVIVQVDNVIPTVLTLANFFTRGIPGRASWCSFTAR